MRILFDNNEAKTPQESLWGFSAYFEEYKLLFDTGSNGPVLLKNMKKQGLNPKEIEYVFITHSHWDHIGGLDSILALNPNLTLFVPSTLSKYLIADLKKMSKKVVICDDQPTKLFNNLYTTGLLGKETPEQSLVIDDQQTKVITGCGHFGIENITKIASKILNKEINAVIGGFHLLKSNEMEISDSIKQLKNLGVKEVLPTHCSGKKAIEMYKESFTENCHLGGIGRSY